MAHVYAGILGPLALLTSLAHGVIQARQTESILLAAWCSLLVFAAVGYAVGRIADRIVEESVGASISAEVAARQAARPSEGTNPST